MHPLLKLLGHGAEKNVMKWMRHNRRNSLNEAVQIPQEILNFGEPGGYCFCPNCGRREQRENYTPCSNMLCPKCEIMMIRQIW
jgi:hypothetical protein